jgi:uncharacterized protein YqjF (DUF2071 family)
VPFLTAEWRDLAMLNYEVDPGILAGHVPAGTELDRCNGRTLVSVVGFRFLRTRVLGIGVPFHRDFEELNLRFYVRRKAEEGWRRGVVFVREVVPRRAVALLARLLYNENYLACPMRHAITPGRVSYGWRSGGRWHELSLDSEGEPVLPAEGSEEKFITEHYWGYARQRDGGTVEYRVEHPRWPVRRAARAALDCDVVAFYGSTFATPLSGAPSSAFLAEGSPVTVHGGVRL